MKFQLLIKTKMLKIIYSLKLSHLVFNLLINVKMPTIAAIFNIYEQDKLKLS